MPERLSFSYYPWITQSISGPDLKQVIEQFVRLLDEAIAGATDNTIRVDPPVVFEVPEQLADIEKAPTGNTVGKIGLLNPIGYAFAHKDVGAVKAIGVVLRPKVGKDKESVPKYRAQLYAHRKTAITKIGQVRGRSIAFGSPQSTSNFLVPLAMLLETTTLHPLTCFARTEFAGGHDKAAIAVYEGRADVGAGHDGVIKDLSTRYGYGDAENVLVNIHWSDEIPSDPVAIHATKSGMDKLVLNALVKIAKPGDPDSTGNKLVKKFWGTDRGFAKAKPEEYDDLVKIADRLSLGREHLLRKA